MQQRSIYNQQQRGFSLIELLVVIAIMGILLSIVWVGFREYVTWQQSRATMVSVHDAITQTRFDTTASRQGERYGIYVGTSTLEIFSGELPAPGDPANTIFPYTDRFRATSSLSDGDWYTVFQRLTAIPSATGTITLTDPRAGTSRTITIHGTGLVE